MQQINNTTNVVISLISNKYNFYFKSHLPNTKMGTIFQSQYSIFQLVQYHYENNHLQSSISFLPFLDDNLNLTGGTMTDNGFTCGTKSI